MPIIPSEDAVRSQLAAILASAPFTNAHRSRRFLEFTVQQTLAGEQDSVKESVIALEVFDRSDNFDPRIDAIVRVEATKLRARLLEYYSGEGAGMPVIVEIPKGTYVPRFSTRAESPSQRPSPKKWRIAAIVAALAMVGAGVWFRFAAIPATREIPAIAVLPFLNLSSEPENEYFSDGLADQLTDALTQVDGLHVASRTSAFSFRGKPLDALEIGTKLHVSAILEGSVQKSDGRLRVTVQLIRTRDGYHLWSQTFDRDFNNVFQVQDEISRAVTLAMKVSLADDSSRRMFRRYTTDPDAFDLYLRGRHELFSLAPGGAARAIALFERAIERDPKFALAYTGIAGAALQGVYSELLPPSEIRRQVKTAAEKAIELDDTLAEAQAILAVVEAQFDWNWTAAEQRFRRALALNPRSPAVHHGYAQSLLLPLGRTDEALAECRTALELDPLSVQMAYCAPWIHMLRGNPEVALAEFKKLQADQPGGSAFAAGISIAAIHARRESEAIAITEQSKVDVPFLIREQPMQLAFIAYSYGRVGRTPEALDIERRLRETARTHYVSPAVMCAVYLGLGRMAEARKAAIQQIEEHGPNALYLAFDPIFATLRQDPQLIAMLKVTGVSLP